MKRNLKYNDLHLRRAVGKKKKVSTFDRGAEKRKIGSSELA